MMSGWGNGMTIPIRVLDIPKRRYSVFAANSPSPWAIQKYVAIFDITRTSTIQALASSTLERFQILSDKNPGKCHQECVDCHVATVN